MSGITTKAIISEHHFYNVQLPLETLMAYQSEANFYYILSENSTLFSQNSNSALKWKTVCQSNKKKKMQLEPLANINYWYFFDWLYLCDPAKAVFRKSENVGTFLSWQQELLPRWQACPPVTWNEPWCHTACSQTVETRAPWFVNMINRWCNGYFL